MDRYRPHFEAEGQGELFAQIEILKDRFPDIGIACNKMPLDQAIETFNASDPPAMQFKPKGVEDMRRLATELKESESSTSVHLPNFKYDKATGEMGHKAEMIEMLAPEAPNNLNLITTHLGWEDASLVLDEQGEWRDTDLANKMMDELSDLFIAGIESGKMMTIENVRYKPHKHNVAEVLGTRPEHLVSVKKKVAQVVSIKTGIPINEVLSKIGYTFDVGHAAGNAHLSKQYLVESWLDQLGEDIRMVHIHDVQPMIVDGVEIEKTHLPLGDGIIDWESFFTLKGKYCPDALMVLEIPKDSIIKSVDYLSMSR